MNISCEDTEARVNRRYRSIVVEALRGLKVTRIEASLEGGCDSGCVSLMSVMGPGSEVEGAEVKNLLDTPALKAAEVDLVGADFDEPGVFSFKIDKDVVRASLLTMAEEVIANVVTQNVGNWWDVYGRPLGCKRFFGGLLACGRGADVYPAS